MKKKCIRTKWLALVLSAAVAGSIGAAEADKAAPASPAAGETIKWQVLSSGGTDASSNGYHLSGTVAQTAVGAGASNGYNLNQGFWPSMVQGGCCIAIRGNANNDPDDKTNISDVTFLLDFLFGIPTGPEPVCWEEGNANGDPDEKVNVSDVSYLLAFLFGIPSGPAPPACP